MKALASCLLVGFSAGVAFPQAKLPAAPSPRPDVIAASPDGALPDAPLPALPQQTFPPEAPPGRNMRVPGLSPRFVPLPRTCVTQACVQTDPASSCCVQNKDVFVAYLNQNAVVTYTPRALGKLAFRDTIDPFNLLTIGGTSAISIGEDAHSPYGPGVEGWAKLSGITLTQTMTGEFLGTFLIPSIDHQDPHYHREPNLPVPRRVLHCIVQPFWTPKDRGGDMVNYSTLLGGILGEAVNITYVPYQEKGWGPSATRISVDWATTPIGNFVTEFVPDFASHFNVRVVFIQRIINQVAAEEGAANP